MTTPKQEVRLREADDTDLAFLFSLAPRLAGASRPAWHSAETMMGFQDRFMTATLCQPQEQSITLVAVDPNNGRSLGYVHALESRDSVTDEPCGHVAILALEAEAEGKGIAGRLMAAAEVWAAAQGWRLLSIDAFADNRRAIDVYTRGGFKSESIRLVKPLRKPV